MKIGAHYTGENKCEFGVWAPLLEKVEVKIIHPFKRTIEMAKDRSGYWRAASEDIPAGSRYFFRINGADERPDPASHFQPDGVHKASEVVDHDSFEWNDLDFVPTPIPEMIIYELHVGTFTPEGTFEAVATKFDHLRSLGVNTIELMPVAQFPGKRNWGYDGAYLFAVQNSYGGPDGLKKLVDTAHQAGLTVLLDVVYNHLGPEGNYLGQFGPYFTDRYRTPWGHAINYDDAHSDGVRNFIIENAIHWFQRYHIDGLRLDAVHGIFDMGARHLLTELAERVENFSTATRRDHYLIAESDLNDVRLLNDRSCGGYGLDAQWSDDFHHAVHTLLTSEKLGYYSDFGRVEHMVKALGEGFVYSWEYSPHRKRYHGSSSRDVPAYKFVVFTQNHDQVGNRMLGERLTALVSFEARKLSAAVLLMSPYVPMLFMGQEYDEDNPFLYFIDHGDPELVKATREGRKREFASFNWKDEPPDPASEETYRRSMLDWEKVSKNEHAAMFELYRRLIELRRQIAALRVLSKENLKIENAEKSRVITMQRGENDSRVFCVMNFDNNDTSLKSAAIEGTWEKILDTSDSVWMGPGAFAPKKISGGDKVRLRPYNFVIYQLLEGD